MTQLAFFSAAFSMTTPVSGRAVRSPDRSSQQVQQPKQQQEQPSIAEDFAARLTPEELQLAQSRAEKQAREALERSALLHDDPEAQERQFLIYTVFVLLTGAKMAARLKLIGATALPDEEPATETEPAATQVKPKRGPGRPKKSVSGGPKMPPVPRLSRAMEESAAPAPAATRKPQPTPDEVLTKYRGLKTPKRAGGQL